MDATPSPVKAAPATGAGGSPAPGATPADPPRAALGSFFRGILGFLERRKMTALISARVSPETQRLIANPPFVFRWVASKAIDEIEHELFQIGGQPICHELGMEMSRNLGGSIVQPVLRAAFFLFGETPEAVFGHLDRFFSLPIRGITFEWKLLEPGHGVIESRFNGPDTPEAAYHVLQGSLQWVFDLLQRQGRVGPAIVIRETPQESRVDFEVRW